MYPATCILNTLKEMIFVLNPPPRGDANCTLSTLLDTTPPLSFALTPLLIYSITATENIRYYGSLLLSNLSCHLAHLVEPHRKYCFRFRPLGGLLYFLESYSCMYVEYVIRKIDIDKNSMSNHKLSH